MNTEQQLIVDYILYLIEEKEGKLPPQEIWNKLNDNNSWILNFDFRVWSIKLDFMIWNVIQYLPAWFKTQFPEKDLRHIIVETMRDLEHLFVNPEKSRIIPELAKIVADHLCPN